MKKTSLIFCFSLILIFSPGHRSLRAEGEKAETSQITGSSSFDALVSRVLEIKTLERSEMTDEERQELKQELRLIRTELNGIKSTKATSGIGPKIYISLGTVLVIVLILLILL